MLHIEAGPYELTKNDKNFYEKVTFCLMNDNSISQRHYNKYGNVMTQKSTACADIETAVCQLDILMSQFKKNKYIQEDTPVSVVPKVLGKRPSSPVKVAAVKKATVSLKKRDAKEENKNIDDTDVRKSKR